MELKTEKIKNRIKEMYNGEYELLSEYKGTKYKIQLKHIPCGTVYDRKANEFLNEGGALCPKCCSKRGKVEKNYDWSKSNIQRLIDNKFGKGDYTLLNDPYRYKISYKSEVRHNICGHVWECNLNSMLSKRSRSCPICANNRRGRRVKDTYLEDMLESGYKWLEEYRGDNKEKLSILHVHCGNIYKVRPNDFQQGYRCPICSLSKRISDGEKEVYDFILSIYDGEVKTSYREYGNKELDIFLPDLNIGIEYNGIYYHSDRFKDKNYHLSKTLFFSEKGIKVIHIFESDWINKRPIVESMLRHKIGKSEFIYNARDLEVFKIDRKTEKEFLNDNHLQGYAISSFSLGLKNERGEVVSLVSFVKSRRNLNQNSSTNSMELLRFANLGGCTVRGAFSKLIKHSKEFIKENYIGIDTLTTFASLDHSTGNVYEVNGFTKVGTSKPSYFYVSGGKAFNRFNFTKSKLRDILGHEFREDLNEYDNCKIYDPNIKRIWNTGNLKYELKI